MSLRGDVCVVTGACGFLGKRLVRLLLEEEKTAEIRLLDRDVQPQVLQSLEGEISFTHITSYVMQKHSDGIVLYFCFF